MTQIDFYVLPDASAKGRERLACRLAEKAYTKGHKVYLHTQSPAQCGSLDEMLWTFRTGSFVPHAILDDVNPQAASPVLIGHAQEPQSCDDVLINLTHEVPLFFSRFARVAEIVDQQTETLQQSRERFRFYKERGYELNSHKLKG